MEARFRAIGIVVTILLAAGARASQAGLLAQVVPVRCNLTARPGETLVQDVEIANQGDTPVVVRVHWSDWQMDENGNLFLVPAGSTATSLAGLVEFEPAEFSLGMGESGHIRVTAPMPANGPATRWGVMLSEVRPAVPRTPQLGPRAIGELGTTFYLSRIPAAEVNADIVGMSYRPLGDSVAITVTVRNAGERHYYVGGRVALTDSAGAAVAAGELSTGVVLPGATRIFQWISPAALLPGRYTATATLDTGAPELTVVEERFSWPAPRARTLAAGRP